VNCSPLTRRTVSLTAALVLALVGGGVHADPIGGDVVVLTGLLAESIEQGATMARQLQVADEQLRASIEALKTLEPSSFALIENHLLQGQRAYASLSQHVGQMGFSLPAIDGEFDRLFPKDLRSVRISDFDGYYGSWQREITESARVAVRAQANVTELEQSTKAARQILSQSSRSAGEVRQLQLIVQLLGAMHQQLATISDSLGKAGRVTATMAASSVAEKQLAREQQVRFFEGLGDRRPSRPLKQLPRPR
jgi:P-type conjugative transfer protein TrbJ